MEEGWIQLARQGAVGSAPGVGIEFPQGCTGISVSYWEPWFLFMWCGAIFSDNKESPENLLVFNFQELWIGLMIITTQSFKIPIL